MPGKFDKELLKKHHFWFLFIPIGIGLLIAWFSLFADLPDAISGTLDKNEKEKKSLAGVKAQPRKALDEFGKQLHTLDAQRIVMWREAWNAQKDVYTWPAGYTENQRKVVQNLPFGEEIADLQVRDQFRGRNIYEKEYKQLVDMMEPMQFRESWDKVLRYVGNWGNVPSSEDMWLAMEDFWVQRELLLAIHKVNRDAAVFHAVTKRSDGTDAPNTPKHRVLQSRFWELEIKLVEDKNDRYLKASLRNISDRLQVMGVGNKMMLQVWLMPEAKRPFEFEVEGTSVEAWRGHYKFTTDSLDGLKAEGVPKPTLDKLGNWLQANKKKEGKGDREFDTDKLFLAELGTIFAGGELDGKSQALILRYAEVGRLPIKTIKSHSIPLDVKATEIFRVEQQFDIRTVPIKQIATVALGQLSDRNKELPLKMPRFSEAMAKKEPPPSTTVTASGETAAAPALPPLSQNGLARYRFVDVTDQIRRMPIGLVIITDQSFMKDILESLMNIKLRFQMTQVDWTRFHGTLNYGAAPAPSGPAVNPLLGGAAPTNNREDQFSANLMEMSIYGIVSLYERFPEAPAPKQPVKAAAKKE